MRKPALNKRLAQLENKINKPTVPKELTDRQKALLDNLEKIEEDFERELMKLKSLDETIQDEDESIDVPEVKKECSRYFGNTNPIMETLPDDLKPVDHSQGAQSW